MDIIHINREYKGGFKAEIDGNEAGFMSYSRAGENKIIINHTEVDPEFKGQNIGKQLVIAAVDYARKNQIKIIPLCRFAKSVFDKTPEIRDVLP